MEHKIPFNDTSRLFLSNKTSLLKSIVSASESGQWLNGEQTSKFANDFAAFCNTDFCLPLASGTDALELSLRTVLAGHSQNEEKEVITVANAGGYSTIACRLVGATPVYADVELENQLICQNSILNCLGPKTKVIIVTHLYGGVVDIVNIRNMLDSNGYGHISIIEDCSHAHGAALHGNRVGSLGDIAAFSFYPTKNLGAMGDAGAIVTSNETLYQYAKSLQQYGWSDKYNISVPYGKNSRIDEIQAAILTSLLPLLNKFNQRRKEIYNSYRNSCSDKLHFLEHGDSEFIAHLAVVRTENRREFTKFMSSKGIAVDIHYPILDHDQTAWKNMPMRIDQHSNLEISNKSVKEIVSLPCFPFLRQDEVKYICDALQEWSCR